MALSVLSLWVSSYQALTIARRRRTPRSSVSSASKTGAAAAESLMQRRASQNGAGQGRSAVICAPFQRTRSLMTPCRQPRGGSAVPSNDLTSGGGLCCTCRDSPREKMLSCCARGAWCTQYTRPLPHLARTDASGVRGNLPVSRALQVSTGLVQGATWAAVAVSRCVAPGDQGSDGMVE